jgi:hypothetical protein
MAKNPSHDVFSVREYEKHGKKESFWTKLGVAFAHKDGKGLDITLQAIPIDGRLVCRIIDRDKEVAGSPTVRYSLT